mmetsp:Transcript_31006/g.23059  ORF Transcript_31006/g.23059 Transcript_31006/m.23059 type:complete len:108 (+) Transcript_31006:368-691(+)
MSEPCFDMTKHLTVQRGGPKGILQFSKSNERRMELGRRRGKREKRWEMLQEESKIEQAHSVSVVEKARGIGFDKQFPRSNQKTDFLPIYMQNMFDRMSLNQHLSRAY